MTVRGKSCALALVWIGTIGACGQAPQQPMVSVDARLDGELARIESVKASIGRTREGEALDGMIAGARGAATDVERLYLLQEPFIRVESLAWMAAHEDSGESLEALTRLWSAEEPAIRSAAACDDPEILFRGLCQAATTRAEKLYAASLPYGKASEPAAGLYYLAEAIAHARLTSFVASLAPREGMTTETRPAADALERAWNEVNDETIAFFGTDPTARTAIPVSVKLKESRELLDRGFTDGALVRLLEARLELSRRQAGARPVRMPTVAPRTSEGSVGAWLDALASGDDETRTALVRRDVEPLHLSLFGRVEETAAAVASTTVTLVRWPYT